MISLQRISANVALPFILILYLKLQSIEAQKPDNGCPIGFNLAATTFKDQAYCYFVKMYPEPFMGKFDNCTNNQFTFELYNMLSLPKTTSMLWTDYKSLHPGGPFVDWSYTDSTGDVLETTYEVKRDPLIVDEELCVAVDSAYNFTAVRCDEEHYRYCIVEAIDITPGAMPDNEGCEDISGGKRFWGPTSTCLVDAVKAKDGKDLTWTESENVCTDKGLMLLSDGWRYSNRFLPPMSTRLRAPILMYPLNIVFNNDGSLRKYFGTTDSKDSVSDWHFDDDISSNENVYSAINTDGVWKRVNSTYRFITVICERPKALRHVELTVENERVTKLMTLTVNDTLQVEDIYCFTDSSRYHPQKVTLTSFTEKSYILETRDNGYYWCTHIDSKNYYISESKKELYIVKEPTETFAVKIRTKMTYTQSTIGTLLDTVWKGELQEYMFYNKTYFASTDKISEKYDNSTLLNFKKAHPELDSKARDLKIELKLKRLYLNAKTALLHVELPPEMKAVKPGQWESIFIEYMKPAYYCDKENKLTLGKYMLSKNCQNITCVGDYNDGVDIVIIPQNDCEVTTQEPTNTTEYDYGYFEPTQAPREEPNTEQENVIEELEELVNGSNMEGDIAEVLSSVSELLNNTDVKVSGNILKLLDEVGASADLDGTTDFTIVKENVAILVSDAQPSLPLKGFRITYSNDSGLAKDNFQMLRENISPSQWSTNKDELMVLLPDSVSAIKRRVSFVVFQDDRAFQSKQSLGLVNSLVVSINVENMTEFFDGEVIDIHLMPLKDPKSDQNQTCAHWQFNQDDSGRWSQEGCTLIRANKTGEMDICRCNHLTHFAEILIPRTGYSKKNEARLEMISILGSCISILGLIFVGLTAVLFKSWRRDYTNKIRLQLCISIFLLSVSFLIMVIAQFKKNDILCMLTGIVLHYFVLASFCWMLVAAFLTYRQLVLVYGQYPSRKLLRACAFAWGVPCVVVGILLLVAPKAYAGQDDKKTPNGAFCYPSGLAMWLTVCAPIAIMLLVNWMIFVIIVRSVWASRGIPGKHNDAKEAFRRISVICVLVFLLGLPWILGLFPVSIVSVYLFTIFVTLQGFFLFLFFVLLNKKTRDLWLHKLKIKKMKVLVSSANRSVDGNVPSKGNLIEMNASKSKGHHAF